MSFSSQVIQQVWEKATIVPENDPNVFRKDQCTAWIRRPNYGDRNSAYGWEVDHIKPESEGGSDDLVNLRPLHWKNNAAKQASRLVCVAVSSGTQNIDKK